MRKVLLAALALGLASPVSAQPLNLNGSDTLLDFTRELLKPANCNIDPAKLVYAGGGSALGETNMVANLQQIAPMSKAMSVSLNSKGFPSQGCKVALDGLAILADDAEPNNCDTAVYSAVLPVEDANGVAGFDDGAGGALTDVTSNGSGGFNYTFTDWRDVLRIVYGGQTEHKTTTACAEAPVGRSAIGTKRCKSDVRATLVAHWEKLFQEGTGCNGADADACSQLVHAFRRDDVSGTTDVFLETLGLPKISSTDKPFCNGAEMEDEDPLRRVCSAVNLDGDEQVCNAAPLALMGPSNNALSDLQVGWRGGPISNPATANLADIGIVLPIVIPQTGAFTVTSSCSTGAFGGSFRYAVMPAGALTAQQQKCPDGNKRVGTSCQWPARKVGTSFFFECLNKKRNVPGAKQIANMDGRVYNLIARNDDGSMKTVERIVSNVAKQQPVHHAFYRLHETNVMPGGTLTATGVGCQFVDATDQIGCLVHASPCSIGYSGLGADLRDPNKALALQVPDGSGPVQPTEDTVRRLNDPFNGPTVPDCTVVGDYAKRYPLSRNLWFNATKGFDGADVNTDPYDFDNITDGNEEQKLAKCACDRFYSDKIATLTGFIPLSSCEADTIDNDSDGNTDESGEACCPTVGIASTLCRGPVRTY